MISAIRASDNPRSSGFAGHDTFSSMRPNAVTFAICWFSISAAAAVAQAPPLFPGPQFKAGTRPSGVAIADFNGDAKLDLAASNYSSSDVSILLGSGAGNFGTAVNVAVGLQPRSVAKGDLNGDAATDLATANYNSDSVSLLSG